MTTTSKEKDNALYESAWTLYLGIIIGASYWTCGWFLVTNNYRSNY